MLIGKNWMIESDDLNVTLYRRYIAKKGTDTGKEKWRTEGYFATVHNALKELVNLEVKGTHLKDLQTIVFRLDELYNLIGGN